MTAVSAGLCGPTRAATLTETFVIPTPQNVTGAHEGSVAPFNPTLGTLNSFSVTINGSFTDPNQLSGDFVEASLDGGDFAVISGNTTQGFGGNPATFSLSFTDTNSTQLRLVTGTGPLTIGDDFTSFDQSGVVTIDDLIHLPTLTYNYTPAVVGTPEPASLALLMAGVAGLAVVRRRSRGG